MDQNELQPEAARPAAGDDAVDTTTRRIVSIKEAAQMARAIYQERLDKDAAQRTIDILEDALEDDRQQNKTIARLEAETTRLREQVATLTAERDAMRERFERDYIHMTKSADGAKKLLEREERHGANANQEIIGARNAEVSLYETFASFIANYRKMAASTSKPVADGGLQ